MNPNQTPKPNLINVNQSPTELRIILNHTIGCYFTYYLYGQWDTTNHHS